MDKLEWPDIEKELRRRGTTQDDLDHAREMFNTRQISTSIESAASINVLDYEEDRATHGDMDDLSTLDPIDLDEYVSQHEISRQQAGSITPSQMELLGEDQQKRVVSRLISDAEPYLRHEKIGYAFSPLLQMGYPHSALKDAQSIKRTNGKLSVSLTTPSDVPLPYGIYPRLLLVYLCTKAIRSDSRAIDLGESFSSFVQDEIGQAWTTGKRGTAINWQKSLVGLVMTSISVVWTDDEPPDAVNKVEQRRYGPAKKKNKSKKADKSKSLNIKNLNIVDDAVLWFNDDFEKGMKARIVISERFMDVIAEYAVPLDIASIKSLLEVTASPLAFDLFCWLCLKYQQMKMQRKTFVRIPWDSIYNQFPTTIKNKSQFIKQSKVFLGKIKSSAYQEAKFDLDSDTKNLILFPSPLKVAMAKK